MTPDSFSEILHSYACILVLSSCRCCMAAIAAAVAAGAAAGATATTLVAICSFTGASVIIV